MRHEHQIIYEQYYQTTVGRFYSADQRLRLLRLFSAAAGIEESSPCEREILQTVLEIDEQNITGFTECKNYNIVSEFFEENGEKRMAVKALTLAYERIAERRGGRSFDSKPDWILSMRHAPTDDTALRMELALFEYSCGNVSLSVKKWKELVNDGYFPALELLACIQAERQEAEEAFYYHALLQCIYTKDLRMPLPAVLERRLEKARGALSAEKAADMMRCAEDAPCFLETEAGKGNVIGFVSTEGGRFVYEP